MAVRMARVDLPHDVATPREGRRFVAKILAQWAITGDPRDRVELLVSELLSNAVLHGGGPIRLELSETDSGRPVRVEVCNGGNGWPHLRHPSPTDLSGRGLRLVEELSLDWGSTSSGGETSVWFEVQADAAM